MAYILMNAEDLWGTAREIVASYSGEFPLTEQEVEVLFDLIRLRLVMSLCISSRRARLFPDNSYLRISQVPAAALLRRLGGVDAGLAEIAFRDAAGFSSAAHHRNIASWLESNERAPASLTGFDVGSARRFVVKAMERSNSEGEYDWGEINSLISECDAEMGFGLPPEKVSEVPAIADWIDIFLLKKAAVRAIFPGEIVREEKVDLNGDVLSRIAIRHLACDGKAPFYSSYEFPAGVSLCEFANGQSVAAGAVIGRVVSAPGSNFGICRLRFASGVYQVLGIGSNDSVLQQAVARTILDPRSILKTEIGEAHSRSTTRKTLLERRRKVFGPSLSLSYRKSLHIVAGRGSYLIDGEGRRYLDCVNNIAHVGHSHSGVANAVSRQARLLNSNTRYLSKLRLEYAERLIGKLPTPLSVVFLVCTGSEANELALRIARTHTNRRGIVVLDWAYHGNTTSLVEISPYKFKRSGGFSQPEHVEIAELPGSSSGEDRSGKSDPVNASVHSVGECIDRLRKRTGKGPAAFFAESVAGVAGQIFYPPGFLKSAFEVVRENGGVCVADEVQCGFGRLGASYWGFEYQDSIPDIVTFGKPAGNGFPLAGVATTPALANSFANGMEYFNSFGGNQVSAAAGLAVMDALENESLLENAHPPANTSSGSSNT